MRSLKLVVMVLTFYGLFHRPPINDPFICFPSGVEELALGFLLTVNGDLKKNRKGSVSTWEHRLLIAIDIASDLALTLSTDQDHVSIDIVDDATAITPLIHDSQLNSQDVGPEYYATSEVTIRSDGMYGVGVAMMEIITGKPMFQRGEEGSFGLLTHWVSSMFAEGEVGSIVDPRLEGEFDMKSVEEALKIAVACISENSAHQPTMDQVVIKLKHSLQIERARLADKDFSFVSLTSIQTNDSRTVF